MARSGLYKSDIKKARDSLISQNINPSVDAVRVALGNTGSKTTIHKYLKELDEEHDGGYSREATTSAALQDLVARLAAQLQDDANIRISEIQAQSAEKNQQQLAALSAVQKEVDSLNTQLRRTETAAHQEVEAHNQTRAVLQHETITRHTLEQQVADLKERLAENEIHRQSIEEKHQHARDALAHYRQSIKEQRDQDQRQHAEQVQQLQAEKRQLQQSMVVKLEEVTRLNQEGARLVADLSHTQKALYDQQAQGRHLEQKLEALQAVQQRCMILELQASEKDKHTHELQNQLAETTKEATDLQLQVHSLQVDLATARAKLELQPTMAAELCLYLESQQANNLAQLASQKPRLDTL